MTQTAISNPIASARELLWRQVPDRALALAEKSAESALKIRKAASGLPREGFLELWLDPDEDSLAVKFGEWADPGVEARWRAALSPLAARWERLSPTDDFGEPGYAKIASRSLAALSHREKRAVDPYLKRIMQATGMQKGLIPGAPHPLIGSLAGGALGAGIGYGAGRLAEWFAPDWNVAPRLAILGGAIGAAPGLGVMGMNYAQGNPVFSNQLLLGEPWDGVTEPSLTTKGSSWGYEDHPDYAFDAQRFNAELWGNPFVSNRMEPREKAVLGGAAMAAARVGGDGSWVAPASMARVAAGMGAGYMSGAVVGKALGVLLGMPNSTQDKLKQTGAWAGLASTLAPMLMGR